MTVWLQKTVSVYFKS